MERKLLALVLIRELLIEEEEAKKQKRKRMWMKRRLQKRPKLCQTNLLRELQTTSPNDYRNFLKMDHCAYEELLAKVTPYIQRQDTHMRKAISPHERLSTTLRFLATGQSFAEMKFNANISEASISKIVIETCSAIIRVLKEYITLPKNEEEWKITSDEFSSLWNFPNCLGALVGKHVNIIKPATCDSHYFNYKKSHSIILMALVNANHEFLMIDVGCNGRVSADGAFSNTLFNKVFKDGQLQIPPKRLITSFDVELPYVFVADDVFPLRENLMKPYRSTGLTAEQVYFNKRLTRARRVVENVFDIISSRFRVLLTTIHLSPEKCIKIVMAICYLHNFLSKKSASSYLLPSPVDDPSTTNLPLANLRASKSHNAANIAKDTRNHFCTYFNTSGKI